MARKVVVVLSAGNMINGGKRGDSLWLFSLDGTIGPLPPESGAAAPGTVRGGGPPRPAPTTAAPAVALPAGVADLAQGARIYGQLCLACHGESGRGGQGNGASLENVGQDVQAVAAVAWTGRNAMPEFRETLTLEQLRDVAHYVSKGLFNTGHAD